MSLPQEYLDEIKDLPALSQFLTSVTASLNSAFRWRDFYWNRTFGGLFQSIFGDGHPPIGLFIPAMLTFFLVLGPKPFLLGPDDPRGTLLGCALVAMSWIALGVGMRVVGHLRVFWLQLVVLSLVCSVVWWAGRDNTEAHDALYRHVLLLVVPLAMLPAAVAAKGVASFLARGVVQPDADVFKERLGSTELFESRDRLLGVRITPWSALRSLLSGPLYYPLVLAYVPALCLTTVFPAWWKLTWPTIIVSALWWLFLAVATLHPRLDALMVLINRTLFGGGQAVVSVAVVVVGWARFSRVGYVSAVIESSSGPVLALFVLAAYSFFWFYAYWTHRFLTEHLIGLLTPSRKPAPSAEYEVSNDTPIIGVKREERMVQIHGAGRVAVVGVRTKDDGEAFNLWEPLELFRELTELESPGIFADLHNRVRFFHGIAHALLIAALVTWGVRAFNGPQNPVLKVNLEGRGSVDLQERLFGKDAGDDVILLAASGGGTRAAMYTTAVLHGLSDIGAIAKLKLASGVSGGGAALAYFAGHWDELKTGDPDAWQRFECTMDDPFIWDVLDGSFELRIFASTRLGELLAESFERRFANQASTFDDAEGFGLILNTALAGHLEVPPCEGDPADQDLRDCARRWRRLTTSKLAGGRLIFTNLKRREAFPGLADLPPKGLGFDYQVVADPRVELTRAAALNANFPPVFSNAAVDAPGSRDRFWVTDGGAVENRGILSLMFALRHAVRLQIATGDLSHLPRIHIVVVEASSDSTGYSQDRGLGSRFGAASKIGSQLAKELLHQIQDDLERAIPGGGELVDVHYLAMPGQLRVDGGLGTHWMLPRNVELGDPAECDPDRRVRTALDGLVAREVIYRLFLSRPHEHHPGCGDDARAIDDDIVESTRRSICEDQPGTPCWQDTVGTQETEAKPEQNAECWRESWQRDWLELVRELS